MQSTHLTSMIVRSPTIGEAGPGQSNSLLIKTHMQVGNREHTSQFPIEWLLGMNAGSLENLREMTTAAALELLPSLDSYNMSALSRCIRHFLGPRYVCYAKPSSSHPPPTHNFHPTSSCCQMRQYPSPS